MGNIRRAEADARVVVLTVDRPPVNALETEFVRDLRTAVAKEAEDAAAIVLTGVGGAFSAGVDTKAAAGLDADGQRAGVEAINELVTTIFGLPLPMVAAINGHAL